MIAAMSFLRVPRAFQRFPHLPAFVRAAVALALLSLALPGAAVEVEGLYRGTAVVQSRADERERVRAFAPAMREVLVKVTGRAEVLQMAPIRQALANAQDYVASWSYSTQRSVDPATGGPVENIVLEAIFYESEIQRLLNRNGIAMWPRNRPVTLVWAVMQDELGDRQVLGSGSSHEMIEAIRQEAARRGLPVLFPLQDLEDRLKLSAQQLWEFDALAVRDASERYQAESVLVLRGYRSLGGELIGEALFLFRGAALSQDLYANSLQAFIAPPLEAASRELSAYYGVLLSGSGGASVPVTMTVEGIDSPEAYAGLMNYVAELADVNGLTLNRVEQGTVTLNLSTGGQIRQLVETIALNDDLQAAAEVRREGEEVILHYRWVGR